MQLERLDGETQKEYRTRYNREFMRQKREKQRAEIAAQNGGVYKRKARGKAKRPPSDAGVSLEEWLELRQQPGEDDIAYQKRYQKAVKARYYQRHKPRLLSELREKRAAKRALKEPTPRKKETKKRKSCLLTDEEWLELRQRLDEDDEEYRKRYKRENQRKIRARNPELTKAKERAYYENNKEHLYAKAKEWRSKNPDKVKASSRRYFERHKDERLRILLDWAAANPERLAEAKRSWWKENRALQRHYSSQYRAQKKKATPTWANKDEILAIYTEAILLTAETGEFHHVDHIIALQGITDDGYEVRGLHVPWNLRAILAPINLSKRNKSFQSDALDQSAEAFWS